MIEIVLPVRKVFSDKIFSGEKRFEFRRTIPSSIVSKIYIYESRGCGAIVGEVIVDQVICETPYNLWLLTKDSAGIDYESFQQYFNGKSKAFAFPIKTFIKYETPKSLSDFGLFSTPQNFVKVKVQQSQ